MKKKLVIILLIVATIVLGFFRDYIFVSINRFIEAGLDADRKLLLLKWVLTGLFSLLYLLSTCAFLYILFQNRTYIWIAVFSYGLLLVVALLTAASGYLFSSFQNVYPFIRTVLGVAESPIVAMILITACFFDKKIVSKQA